MHSSFFCHQPSQQCARTLLQHKNLYECKKFGFPVSTGLKGLLSIHGSPHPCTVIEQGYGVTAAAELSLNLVMEAQPRWLLYRRQSPHKLAYLDIQRIPLFNFLFFSLQSIMLSFHNDLHIG